MSKFLQLKPHGSEIIVLLLIVGAYFGIREIYGDIFRGDGFWKTSRFCNLLRCISRYGFGCLRHGWKA